MDLQDTMRCFMKDRDAEIRRDPDGPKDYQLVPEKKYHFTVTDPNHVNGR